MEDLHSMSCFIDMKVVTGHRSMLKRGTFQLNPMFTALVFWFWRFSRVKRSLVSVIQ